MSETRDLGDFGERLAAERLARTGYAILARNILLPPWGEIDIVAQRDGALALVEVRTRRGLAFGGAAFSISPTKRRRMLNAAAAYLAGLPEPLAVRIDVMLVNLDRSGRLLSIEHIENAVQAE